MARLRHQVFKLCHLQHTPDHQKGIRGKAPRRDECGVLMSAGRRAKGVRLKDIEETMPFPCAWSPKPLFHVFLVIRFRPGPFTMMGPWCYIEFFLPCSIGCPVSCDFTGTKLDEDYNRWKIR
jgi:hypothetical protein